MAQITLKGNPLKTVGNLPAVGSTIPDFRLTKADLSDIRPADFAGKKVIFNIFPSIDTGTCAASVRKFNTEAAGLSNTIVLCVSADLPFAQKRFCSVEGIANVVTASDFKDKKFATDWGLAFADGPMQGLMSRSVVVADASGKVIYTEQVAETTAEPDYEKALSAAKSA